MRDSRSARGNEVPESPLEGNPTKTREPRDKFICLRGSLFSFNARQPERARELAPEPPLEGNPTEGGYP